MKKLFCIQDSSIERVITCANYFLKETNARVISIAIDNSGHIKLFFEAHIPEGVETPDIITAWDFNETKFWKSKTC